MCENSFFFLSEINIFHPGISFYESKDKPTTCQKGNILIRNFKVCISDFKKPDGFHEYVLLNKLICPKFKLKKSHEKIHSEKCIKPSNSQRIMKGINSGVPESE